jgi:nucleoside-diphosphate-sugar epimerase
LSTLPINQRPELITLVSRNEISHLADVVSMNLRIKYIQADLLDEWKFDRSVTHVLQLAADGSANAYSQKASDDFVKFSLRLVEWCETLSPKPVVVHASSGACFGYFPLNSDVRSKNGASSTSNEIWSKATFVEGRLNAEQLLLQAHDLNKFDLRIARLFSFIGEHIRGKTHYAAPSFISMAKTSGVIHIKGDPMTVRSYLSADDMANWLVAALQADAKLPMLSIGSSAAVTMLDLAEFIAEQFSAKVVINDQHTAGDIYVADNELTKDLLKVGETISWREALLDLIKV